MAAGPLPRWVGQDPGRRRGRQRRRLAAPRASSGAAGAPPSSLTRGRRRCLCCRAWRAQPQGAGRGPQPAARQARAGGVRRPAGRDPRRRREAACPTGFRSGRGTPGSHDEPRGDRTRQRVRGNSGRQAGEPKAQRPYRCLGQGHREVERPGVTRPGGEGYEHAERRHRVRGRVRGRCSPGTFVA